MKLLFKLIICKSFNRPSSIQCLSLSLSSVMRAPSFVPSLSTRGTVQVLLLWLQGKVSERARNGKTACDAPEREREQRNGTDAIKWKLDYDGKKKTLFRCQDHVCIFSYFLSFWVVVVVGAWIVLPSARMGCPVRTHSTHSQAGNKSIFFLFNFLL